MRAHRQTRLAIAALAASASAWGVVALDGQAPPRAPGVQAVSLDVVALDSAGGTVSTLGPDDLRVTIDGEPRSVISLRYVFRGTGALAAARTGSSLTGMTVAAEPSRLVFVAVDEDSFAPGGERAVASVVSLVRDALAPADRVALVTLPAPTSVVVGSDRRPFREALAGIRGRAAAVDAGVAPIQPPRSGDPFRVATDEESRDARGEPAGRSEVSRERRPNERSEPSEADAAGGPPTLGRSSIEVLAGWLRSLNAVQGPKTVIYTWGGTWGADPGQPGRSYQLASDVDLLVSAAAASRTVVHVIAVARSEKARPDRALERLAKETGGVLLTATARTAPVERLTAAMAGHYILEVDERPGDRTAIRSLEVATTRSGIRVLAARRWTARDDALPAPIRPSPTTATADKARPGPVARAAAAPPDAELEAVVARASDYLASYLREFSSVVAEEEFTQSAVDTRPPGIQVGQLGLRRESVRLRSDLLLLRSGDDVDWIPFRDVFEVDGKPIRDREDRLRALFLEHPDTAMQEGQRITRESSRFNVGQVERTINTPTMGLFFLLPRERPRLRFDRNRDDTLDGVRVWRVDFEEIEGPTLIRESKSGKDLPSTGTLWIEPATGRVFKTLIRCGDTGFRMEMSTTFRRSETLGLWAPAEMRETYWMRNGTYRITGLARYGKFRRFAVTTDEQVTVPKD